MVDMHEKAKEFSERVYTCLFFKEAAYTDNSTKAGLIPHAKQFLGMSMTKTYSGAYAYKLDRAEELVDVAVQDGWFIPCIEDALLLRVNPDKYVVWEAKFKKEHASELTIPEGDLNEQP